MQYDKKIQVRKMQLIEKCNLKEALASYIASLIKYNGFNLFPIWKEEKKLVWGLVLLDGF